MEKKRLGPAARVTRPKASRQQQAPNKRCITSQRLQHVQPVWVNLCKWKLSKETHDRWLGTMHYGLTESDKSSKLNSRFNEGDYIHSRHLTASHLNGCKRSWSWEVSSFREYLELSLFIALHVMEEQKMFLWRNLRAFSVTPISCWHSFIYDEEESRKLKSQDPI